VKEAIQRDHGAMWRVRRVVNSTSVVLELSGRLQGEHLPALQDALRAEAADQNFVLDLKQLRLVDQDTVRFLAGYEASGARLRNCPAYVREWIAKEEAVAVEGDINGGVL
jgi:hypothetical protein